MRKGIFGAVVIMLAGACWVVAQTASSRQASPYGAQAPAAAKAVSPDNRALPSNGAANDPIVLPTTELDVPGIPPAPPATMPIPTLNVHPPMAIPMPSVEPYTPPAYKIPDAPIETPNKPIEKPKPFVLPAPPVDLPRPEPLVAPAPVTAPQYPAYSVPIVDEKPPVRSVTTPAIAGLPDLPAVPGVPALPNPGGPVGSIPSGPMVGNTQWMPPNPNVGGPTQLQPPPLENPRSVDPRWSVDDPGNWQSRPRLRDHLNDPNGGQILGPRIWGSADYLMWLVQTQHTPPLVQNITGALGGGTQAVNLFPDPSINYGLLSGVRGTLGFWLNPSQSLGFETSYFWFGRASTGDTFNSEPNGILARPLFNANTGLADFFRVSDLNGSVGVVRAHSMFHVEGGEANFLFNSASTGPNFNLIGGFRYLQVSEQLSIDQFAVNDALNMSASSYDRFGTRNNFFGGQLGLRWNYEGQRFFASLTAKVAFGAMNETVKINGQTFVNTPTGTNTAPGGVLALPTNIGTYSRQATAYIPEATANIGYRFTPWATGFVGYNFMFISELVRAGRQIDPVVNPENLPFGAGSATASHPSFQFRGDNMWLQGINFGLRFQY